MISERHNFTVPFILVLTAAKKSVRTYSFFCPLFLYLILCERTESVLKMIIGSRCVLTCSFTLYRANGFFISFVCVFW